MIRRSDNGKPCLVQGFLLCCGALLLWAACHSKSSEGSDQLTLQGNAQGSTFTIKYLDSLHRDFSGPVDSIFRVIDGSLSLWDSSSNVSRWNRSSTAPTVFVDRHFQSVFVATHGVWLSTNGAFDPTVKPLVDAWGFGRSGKHQTDTANVDSLVEVVGLQHLRLDTSTRGIADWSVLVRDVDGVQFDPNGIAQGYTVDVIALYLQQQGITNYMVEVGGEVRCSGLNESGKPWLMQIDKPEMEHVQQTVVPLQDKSLATSGNYRKFIEIGGKRYGHTIDPRTGRPAMNALLSASVIADDCVTADALGTALMVMGPEEGKAWLSQHREVEAYLIIDDGSGGYVVWNTPGWPTK